jgi:alpha-D-ribose 1-methylphosphonate 5-triphosphate synthase subunit PhnG
MQERIETDIIAPLAEAQAGTQETVREETEATKVNFFTMVRGDN